MSRKKLAGRVARLEGRRKTASSPKVALLPAAVRLKGPKAEAKWVREHPSPVMLPERTDDPAVRDALIREIERRQR